MLDNSTTPTWISARRPAVAALAVLAIVGAGVAPAFAEAEFRTIDGSGNNLANPEQGSAGVAFLRMLDDDYGDGISTPAGADRKSARIVSNMVSFQLDSMPNRHGATSFTWQWGQFLDHDLTFTALSDPAERFDIAIPTADPFFDPGAVGGFFLPFTRSAGAIGDSGIREQANSITAFIDASNVYGSDDARAAELRTHDGSGQLRTSGRRWLPLNTNGFPNDPTANDPSLFLAGDIRVNEQIGLTAMHTLFVREHNRIARKGQLLRRIHRSLGGDPDDELTGDLRYQLARVFIGAEMQAITYREFLPVLLGENTVGSYLGYDDGFDASIGSEFATAAYRFGHSLIPNELLRLNADGVPIRQGNVDLDEAFFSPDELRRGGGLAPLLRGLAAQSAEELDMRIVEELRSFLFGPPGAGGLDLAALNIQRGRDHGMPSYNDTRRILGLDPAEDFAAITSDLVEQKDLSFAYDDVEDVDLWTGLLAEDEVGGAMVGELLRIILTEQFERLRSGDRFWYERTLSSRLQRKVERQTLARVIRRNTPVAGEIQDDVFRLP